MFATVQVRDHESLSPVEFSDEVLRLHEQDHLTLTEAILQVCGDLDIDYVDVKDHMTDALYERLRSELVERRLLPKTKTLADA